MQEIDTEPIEFTSAGTVVRGVIHWPPARDGSPLPVIVEGPGWHGVRCGQTSERYHGDFVEAGYAVLTFDYRGWGASDGERGWIRPAEQREDIHAAITYAETRPELDLDRLVLWGKGSTGCPNAVQAAVDDPRVRCLVIQSCVSDVGAWAEEMHEGRDWDGFLARIGEDARDRVAGGPGTSIDPVVELMGEPPERKAVGRANPGKTLTLGSVEQLLRLRPLDVVARLAPRPLLVVSAVEDHVTRQHHAVALFEAAGAPKKLIRIHDVPHYLHYRVARERHVLPWLEWLDRHGCGSDRAAFVADREALGDPDPAGPQPYVTTLERT